MPCANSGPIYKTTHVKAHQTGSEYPRFLIDLWLHIRVDHDRCMNVSRHLIEKYHQGLCTPEEAKAVEAWLDTDEDLNVIFPEHLASKPTIKEEIWENLQRDLQKPQPLIRSFPQKRTGWSVAAAVVLVAMASFIGWEITTAPLEPVRELSVKSGKSLPQLKTDELTIEFGRNSKAVYNKKGDVVSFCGIIRITPKKDMKLSFNTTCQNGTDASRQIEIKQGSSYFAMDLKNRNSSELLVMEEDLIFELPPLITNSLIAQFDI